MKRLLFVFRATFLLFIFSMLLCGCITVKPHKFLRRSLIISTESIGLIGIDPYEYVYLTDGNKVYLPFFIGNSFSCFKDLPNGEYSIELGITVPKYFDMSRINYDSKILLQESKGSTDYSNVDKKIVYDGSNCYIQIVLQHRPSIDYSSRKPNQDDIDKYFYLFKDNEFIFNVLMLIGDNDIAI